jgi:hypothetical protein
VEGTFIIAIFLATVIMLTSRAIKIKKRIKSINWRNIQKNANNVVNILTSLLYIILLYQAIQNKFFEIKVSLTFFLIYLSYNGLYKYINLIIKIYFRWRRKQTAILIQTTQLFQLRIHHNSSSLTFNITNKTNNTGHERITSKSLRDNKTVI